LNKNNNFYLRQLKKLIEHLLNLEVNKKERGLFTIITLGNIRISSRPI